MGEGLWGTAGLGRGTRDAELREERRAERRRGRGRTAGRAEGRKSGRAPVLRSKSRLLRRVERSGKGKDQRAETRDQRPVKDLYNRIPFIAFQSAQICVICGSEVGDQKSFFPRPFRSSRSSSSLVPRPSEAVFPLPFRLPASQPPGIPAFMPPSILSVIRTETLLMLLKGEGR